MMEVLVVPTRGMLWSGITVTPSVYHAPGCRRVAAGAYRMLERTAQDLQHRPAECSCLKREPPSRYTCTSSTVNSR